MPAALADAPISVADRFPASPPLPSDSSTMPYVTDDDSKAVTEDNRNPAAVARGKIGVRPMAGGRARAEATPRNWPKGNGKERP